MRYLYGIPRKDFLIFFFLSKRMVFRSRDPWGDFCADLRAEAGLGDDIIINEIKTTTKFPIR